MKPDVHILVSVPDEAHFASCTACFDTLRTGFPTAEVFVYINYLGDLETRRSAAHKAVGVGAHVEMLSGCMHHAEWIRMVFDGHHTDNPLVILDADTLFWECCEAWDFGEKLLAGYWVPQIWNDFAQCVSAPRLHTSFLWFNQVSSLHRHLQQAYPQAHGASGEYCPCDPFMPAVKFIGGLPFFWDSCANLYDMVGPALSAAFGSKHKRCYEHLNSASFFAVMLDRLENKAGFQRLHRDLVHTPGKLRGLWENADAYYEQKRLEAVATFQ